MESVEVTPDVSKYKSPKQKSIDKPNSISPTAKKEKSTKKRKEVASRVFDIDKPKLVKQTPKQIETAAVNKPYKKPKLEVYLNLEKKAIKHLKVRSLGPNASCSKLKAEADQNEENTIDLMKRHYHYVNNNVLASPSSFLRRLEEAKNNYTCPDEEDPFDPAHN